MKPTLTPFHVGQRVRATRTVTESGEPVPPGPMPTFAGPGYAPHHVHARPGDLGTVETVDADGHPTVRFDRTGSATIVGDAEVEPLALRRPGDEG